VLQVDGYRFSNLIFVKLSKALREEYKLDDQELALNLLTTFPDLFVEYLLIDAFVFFLVDSAQIFSS
jgi:hypothetical protein